MKYPPPTPEAFQVLSDKLETFMAVDESQFLNKEIWDLTPSVTSQPKGAQRTHGHVVPSKREEQRRRIPGRPDVFPDLFEGTVENDDDIPF